MRRNVVLFREDGADLVKVVSVLGLGSSGLGEDIKLVRLEVSTKSQLVVVDGRDGTTHALDRLASHIRNSRHFNMNRELHQMSALNNVEREKIKRRGGKQHNMKTAVKKEMSEQTKELQSTKGGNK